MMVGTMAAYKPYSGGSPAIMAKATAWGRTMTAPVRPAMPSAFRLERFTCGHQRSTGKNLYIQSGQAAASNRINYFEFGISFFWGRVR